jgi:transcriptional regulator with XRE-family HTH domain
MTLKEMRLEKGLSLGRMSELSGVPVKNIRRYEKGERIDRLFHLARIAKVLDVSIFELPSGNRMRDNRDE